MRPLPNVTVNRFSLIGTYFNSEMSSSIVGQARAFEEFPRCIAESEGRRNGKGCAVEVRSDCGLKLEQLMPVRGLAPATMFGSTEVSLSERLSLVVGRTVPNANVRRQEVNA